MGRPRKRGAPKGNKNALKTGRYTKEAKRAAKRRSSHLQAKLNKAIVLIDRINRYLAQEKIMRAQRLANDGGEISKNE
ncbi:MAG TPA: hypothetical protein VEH07_03090 [Alphaproteobacteria bacterium]|nr:hypothetical protein [Alphaproteobacteria bacterium]